MKNRNDQQSSLWNSMDNTTPAPVPAAAVSTPAKKSGNKPQKQKLSIRPHDTTQSLEKIYDSLVSGLRKFFEKQHCKRAVLGVSGGVDSTLVLQIAVDALGASNITALIMPELGLSKQENIDHAKLLCRFFEVNCYYQPINNFLPDFTVVPWKPTPVAHMNTKARVRAVLLYSCANTEKALVLGTSNKSELLLGYGTKYGDMAADVEVIGELLKTDVVRLAEYAGLPPEITTKTPSAELAPGQTDEEEIGASYYDLDRVLSKLDLGHGGCIDHGLPAPIVSLVFRRIKENKHKTRTPFVIKAQW